jgi:hypothetical protein
LGFGASLWRQQRKWEAVVLPAWHGSKTALAGSKFGLGWRKSGDFGPVQAFTYPKPALAEPWPLVPHKKL